MKRLDETVHKYGWMSSEYTCGKISRESRKLILGAISGVYEVVMMAEYIGHDRHHGSKRKKNMTIPVSFMKNAF